MYHTLEYGKGGLLMESLQTKCSHAAEARIRIGVLSGVPFLGFAYALSTFRKKFPRIGLEIYENGNDELMAALGDGTLDLAFVINPSSCDDVVCYRLYDDELVLVAPLDHPLASRKEISLRDLEGETVLFSESDIMYRNFLGIMEAAAPDVRVKFFLTHGTGILNNVGLVACGFGVTVLTRNIAEGCQHEDFAKIRIEPRIPRTFCLVVSIRSSVRPEIANFAREITEVFVDE